MTTGSEGVSLRLPHDFFSQHRLKSKTEMNDMTISKKKKKKKDFQINRSK